MRANDAFTTFFFTYPINKKGYMFRALKNQEKTDFATGRVALGVPDDMMTEFEDLASASRGHQYEDITPYLGKQPLARVALRKARDNGISDELWEAIIKSMDNPGDRK